MNTITIPKKEYNNLLDARLRYEYVRQILAGDIFSAPSAKKRTDVMRALRGSGKYAPAFLKSVEKGLQRSSYFQ